MCVDALNRHDRKLSVCPYTVTPGHSRGGGQRESRLKAVARGVVARQRHHSDYTPYLLTEGYKSTNLEHEMPANAVNKPP